MAYVEVLPDERGATVAAFLWRALAWYQSHGIRVQRVMTDNAFAYLRRASPEITREHESPLFMRARRLTGHPALVRSRGPE